jgi:hypothetical protein
MTRHPGVVGEMTRLLSELFRHVFDIEKTAVQLAIASPAFRSGCRRVA